MKRRRQARREHLYTGRLWLRGVKLKPNALHRQLGISSKKTIPRHLLEVIHGARSGDIIHNRTGRGKRLVHVSPLLKHRVQFVLNARSSR